MRLSGNVRRIATVSLVCTALIAAGYAPALATNKNDHHKHWYSYFYDQMESLARSLSALGSRVMGRLDSLSTRVDELAATVAGQANTSLAARIDQLASDLAQLGVKLDNNVALLNGRIDQTVAGFDQKLSGVNASIASLSSSLTDLSVKLGLLDKRVTELEASRTASGGLSVVDVGGARLGDFVGFDPTYTPLVGMSTQNRSFVLRVTEHGLRGDMVFFSALDCQGTPYVAPILDNGDLKKPLALAGIKKNTATNVYTVYVTDANQALSLGGFDVWSAAQNGSGCENFFDVANSGPALPAMVQMELPDTGPYRVN
jgi:uncharacterized protein YukE